MPRVSPPKDPEYLTTLERGLSVLRAFDQTRPEMQLSEVATATGLSAAVARRCLNTLVGLGYVGRHGRRFLLRPEVLAFGSAYASSMNIETIVTPPLQRLRDATGDSASMAVRSGADILYVAHVSTDRRIRLAVSAGTRFPWHATSLGKAIVAFEPTEVRAALLEDTPVARLTDRTLCEREPLAERLRAVAARGYDQAQDELDYGIVSVGVPVCGADGVSLAAINCSTSTTRVEPSEMIETRLPLLREAAREIEAALTRFPALARSLAR